MQKTLVAGLCGLLALTSAGAANAALLNPSLVKALTVFDSTGTLNYNASTDLMAIQASGLVIQFNGVGVLLGATPSTVTINIKVNGSGGLIGGVSGDDFSLTGLVDIDNDGIAEYNGTLLTGEIAAFGFQNSSGTAADLYDFKFKTTGGSLAGVYGKFFGIQMTSENSNFNNNFCVNFAGGAKGTIGNLTGDKCARPPNYWKCNSFPNNIQSLTIGGVTYNRTELLNILAGKKPNGESAGRDPNVKLARFLITVKLSLLAGANPSGEIVAVIAEADSYLSKNPPGSDVYGCNDAGVALTLKDSLKYWVEEADCNSPCDPNDWNHNNYGCGGSGWTWCH